jgi:hypothetical protein
MLPPASTAEREEDSKMMLPPASTAREEREDEGGGTRDDLGEQDDCWGRGKPILGWTIGAAKTIVLGRE